MQWEVYAHGVENAYTILGGECPTVGAVGAFLQGGGVSSTKSFMKGLAVDNVLEYQVVTSNVSTHRHIHVVLLNQPPLWRAPVS